MAAIDRQAPAIGLAPRCRSAWQRGAKRAMDIAVSSIALLLLSPFLLAIAVAVKAGSRGPVLYRWKVAGWRGREIVSYKFRSMVDNADELKQALQSRNEMTGPVFKLTGDPRITAVGKVLRKFSLDELPQLWSVLVGDLSLVGPRPPLQTECARFTERQKLKLEVKPGLTCLWQVNGRNKVSDFDEWVNLDLKYIREWSLALDLKILLRTIPVVLLGRGK